ncbi:MAG TPA: SHOCT domain-containing protein [Streptosporangiaceae bacterium]|jgi:hypothetical protein
MPLDRHGRPGLLGAIDPGYVITGGRALTAAVGHGPARHAEDPKPASAYQEAEQAVAEAEAEAAAAERAAQQYATFGHRPDPEPAGNDLVSSLAELAGLRDKGALSQSEYQAAKTRLLST